MNERGVRIGILVLIGVVGAGLLGTASWLHPTRGGPRIGACPDCNSHIARIQYGHVGDPPQVPPTRLPNGRSYAAWKRGAGLVYDGGPTAGRRDPGWVCEGCGREWLLPLSLYHGREELSIRLEFALERLWPRSP